MNKTLSTNKKKCLLSQYANNQISSDVLRHQDSIVVRLNINHNQSIILKMWRRTGWKAFFRRLSRTDPASKEARGLEWLNQSSVNSPTILGKTRIHLKDLTYTDAIFIEDIGECTSAMNYIHKLMRDSREQSLTNFEEEIINLTQVMISSNILDADHSLINMVVDANGKLYRLDCELTEKVFSVRLSFKTYGLMLGRLLISHILAVQPQTARSVNFAQQLQTALLPSKRCLKIARDFVEVSLLKQYEEIGVDSRFTVPW